LIWTTKVVGKDEPSHHEALQVECVEHHVRLRLPHGPAARRQVLQSSHLGRSQKQPDEPNNEADQRLDVVAVLDRTRFRRRNTDLQMHVRANDDATAPRTLASVL